MSINEELAQKLLERNRVGALMRVFAATPKESEVQIQSALTALEQVLALRTGDRPTFNRIDFLVSNDQSFEDSDYGETAELLRDRIRNEFPNSPVNVYDIKKGDIYAMLLNYGVATHLEDRIPYSVILSHWVHTHITSENVNALLAAMQNKARVAGLVIPEIAETVRQGRIANTFAVWHNKSLMTVGGFDLRAGKPMKSDLAHAHTVASHFDDKEFKYHAAGCEEIVPLLRFTRYFPPSISVVEPITSDTTEIHHYETDWQERHQTKLATKDARQRYMANLTGLPIENLLDGLLSD